MNKKTQRSASFKKDAAKSTVSAIDAANNLPRKNLYYEDELVKENFSFFMFKKLLSYAAKYRKTYFGVIVIYFLGCAASLTPTALMAVIINRVLPDNGILPPGFLQAAIVIVSAVVGIYLFNCICNYFSSLISQILGNKIIYDLRRDIFSKLLSLDFNYFDSRPTGKILVRATSYVDQIAYIFINRLVHILYNVFIMIICLTIVFVLDYRLGATVFAAIIPLAFLLYFIAGTIARRARLDKNKHSNLTAFVTENINGREISKAFNRQELNTEIQQDLMDKHLGAFMRTTRVREAFFPLAHGTIQVVCIILIYIVSLLIIRSSSMTLTLGIIVSITTYMQTFSEALREFCNSLEAISTLTSNCERIFEMLGTAPEVKENENAVTLENCKGGVSFKNIVFSYDGKTNVLENFSLDVEPGQSIALIGPTGAGKTTIINLLSRFYNVGGGGIYIDGKNIEDFTLNSLRKNVGVMMQDSFLFSGTVRENICFSLENTEEEKCIEAARFVGADDFIRKLPQGYDTVINNACELSAGERQLISFARLIYSDPKIVILDEATSNIDTKTEAKLQAALKDFLKERTSFVIAHRLSTIRNSDKIVYIDNKNIAESGTHEELMKLNGKYCKLLTAED